MNTLTDGRIWGLKDSYEIFNMMRNETADIIRKVLNETGAPLFVGSLNELFSNMLARDAWHISSTEEEHMGRVMFHMQHMTTSILYCDNR